MRNVDTLLDFEDIVILYQYLYMSDDNYVTVDNGVAKLEIRMNENGYFHAKNLNFPDLPDLSYTDMMTIPNMLGIIDQLKHTHRLLNLRMSLSLDGTNYVQLLQQMYVKIKCGKRRELFKMRTNQIEVKVTRIIDDKLVVFKVYSDANNFSEALIAANKAILDEVTKTDVIPSFGCVELYNKE